MIENRLLTGRFVKENLPIRPVDANKGTMGTLLSVTGCYSMAGAGILSLRAALRCGTGLVKQVCTENIYPMIAPVVPEAVYIPVKESKDRTVSKNETEKILLESEKATAVLFGCGLKNTGDVFCILKNLLIRCDKPQLIDADGLNALSKDISLLDSKICEVVLTPHVLEMSRLLKCDKEYVMENREKVVSDFTREHKDTVLVLKGHNTIIGKNGELFINPTGNQGMAKGGSGDVLSGMIASFMAQNTDPFMAAKIGVYLHGLAGDIAKDKYTDICMLPSDLIKHIPDAMKMINNSNC